MYLILFDIMLTGSEGICNDFDILADDQRRTRCNDNLLVCPMIDEHQRVLSGYCHHNLSAAGKL